MKTKKTKKKKMMKKKKKKKRRTKRGGAKGEEEVGGARRRGQTHAQTHRRTHARTYGRAAPFSFCFLVFCFSLVQAATGGVTWRRPPNRISCTFRHEDSYYYYYYYCFGIVMIAKANWDAAFELDFWSLP